MDLVEALKWDCMITDPPNGGALCAGGMSGIFGGPAVINLAWIHGLTGIIFAGSQQVGMYRAPREMGFVFIEGHQAQPVLFYGVQSDDLISRAPEQPDVRHPGAKPVEWFTWAVAKTTGTVLDPFMGSGTCGIACAELKRPFIGIEVVEQYFDLACERIEKAYNSRRGAPEFILPGAPVGSRT